MNNIDKYNEAFVRSFQVEKTELYGLEYQAIPDWDSVGHMLLVSNIEDAFGIMMSSDDIIDFSSYEKGIAILRKYDVKL